MDSNKEQVRLAHQYLVAISRARQRQATLDLLADVLRKDEQTFVDPVFKDEATEDLVKVGESNHRISRVARNIALASLAGIGTHLVATIGFSVAATSGTFIGVAGGTALLSGIVAPVARLVANDAPRELEARKQKQANFPRHLEMEQESRVDLAHANHALKIATEEFAPTVDPQTTDLEAAANQIVEQAGLARAAERSVERSDMRGAIEL